MTPAERVVVEATIRFVSEVERGQVFWEYEYDKLEEAVLLLEAERADPATPKEQDITWGQVVVDDEIYSAKTGKWYKVTTTLAMIEKAGHVKVWATGLPKAIEPKAANPVRVRRGEMGKAVDVLASVLWSGQSAPDAAPVKDPGPTFAEVDPATDPEASED
jgi:hypothetical protein